MPAAKIGPSGNATPLLMTFKLSERTAACVGPLSKAVRIKTRWLLFKCRLTQSMVTLWSRTAAAQPLYGWSLRQLERDWILRSGRLVPSVLYLPVQKLFRTESPHVRGLS